MPTAPPAPPGSSSHSHSSNTCYTSCSGWKSYNNAMHMMNNARTGMSYPSPSPSPGGDAYPSPSPSGDPYASPSPGGMPADCNDNDGFGMSCASLVQNNQCDLASTYNLCCKDCCTAAGQDSVTNNPSCGGAPPNPPGGGGGMPAADCMESNGMMTCGDLAQNTQCFMAAQNGLCCKDCCADAGQDSVTNNPSCGAVAPPNPPGSGQNFG